jgi:hypothetical protein
MSTQTLTACAMKDKMKFDISVRRHSGDETVLNKVRKKIQKNLKDKNEGVNGCLVPGERLVASSAAGRSGSTDEGLKIGSKA